MSDQQPETTSTDESGLDRRKFLLRTTAITAGAWAAPSILTIDRAFGEPGSEAPCPCSPNTVTDGATAKGTFVAPFLGLPPTNIRQHACLNDDTIGIGPVTLPEGLGTLNVTGGGCSECSTFVEVANVDLLVAGQVITADALHANAACSCDGSPTGGSTVYNVQVGALGPFESSSYELIPVPGLGYVALNEGPGDATGTPGEFNAMHIFFETPGDGLVDLKLASAKVECA